MQVQPAKVLKAVATQIADRDNVVRSAALDLVVCVYGLIGDDVHKLIGPLPDMCVDLITERIKRSGKTAPAGTAAAAAPPAVPTAGPAQMAASHKAVKGNGNSAPVASAPVSSIPREFSLDLDALQLGAMATDFMPALMPTDADDLFAAPLEGGGGVGSADGGLDALVARIRSEDPMVAIQALKVREV